MPAMIWSSVLLPEPFAPMMPKASPRATEKLTSRKAHNPSCGTVSARSEQMPQPAQLRVSKRVVLREL